MRHRFKTVVEELESVAADILRGRTSTLPSWVSDRDLHHFFRRSTKLNVRQRFGAFFTGQSLSQQVLRHAPVSGTVCDIACGTGSLLLTHANKLRVGRSLDETLDLWGQRLVGREVQELLLRVARARIVIAAAQRLTAKNGKAARTTRKYEQLLPDLKIENGLQSHDAISKATDIVLNPPFTSMVAPKDCPWAEGSVNSAAWFVHYCLMHAHIGTRITAILPDVLRSGERYGRWRAYVELCSSVEAVEMIGRFDQHADVDVFILRLRVKAKVKADATALATRWVTRPAASTLGDFFRVTVGSLVSYRTPAEGPWHPYLDVSAAHPWGTVRNLTQSRRFVGRLQEPPFVAVRRTSSPGDRNRAIPTVIMGTRPVAVENHLLVLEPFDKTVHTCRAALEMLSRPRTTEWLNERIRCRHLTVESVREIPWNV